MHRVSTERGRDWPVVVAKARALEKLEDEKIALSQFRQILGPIDTAEAKGWIAELE